LQRSPEASTWGRVFQSFAGLSLFGRCNASCHARIRKTKFRDLRDHTQLSLNESYGDFYGVLQASLILSREMATTALIDLSSYDVCILKQH